jgi:hypothetical protein
MAVKKNNKIYVGVLSDVVIEVISIKGSKVYKKQMIYSDALEMPKLKGWKYIYYQLGASQFSEAKTL